MQLNTLEFALVLLVAAIPVAMPTVLSVAMAVGARLLAKKEAIVTRLSAIEKLAGVDVLCSVKISSKDFRVRKLVQKLGLVRGPLRLHRGPRVFRRTGQHLTSARSERCGS